MEARLSTTQNGSGEYWSLCANKARLLRRGDKPDEALLWLNGLPLGTAPDRARQEIESEWGGILRDIGRLKDARAHLERSLGLAQRLHLPRRVAALQIRLSEVLLDLNEPARADELLDAARIYKPTKNETSLAPYILHNRGLVRWKTNRFEEALAPLAESAREFRAARSSNNEANVLITLGTCYLRLGRYDKARESYRRALEIGGESDRHLGTGHLGDVYFEERQFEQAAESFRAAANEVPSTNRFYHALWLGNLAGALIEQKRWAEAEKINRQALAIAGSLDNLLTRDHARVNQAVIEAGNGRNREAEQLLKKLLAEPGVDLGAELDASAELAQVYAATGRNASAERQFESALKLADASGEHLTEDQNKITYLASLMKLHQQYVEFLMDRKRSADALAVAESSRARLLRERMNLPRRAAARGSGAEYEAIARSTGATLLAYQVAPSASWVWVVTASRITAAPLPPEQEIRRLVERYQATVEVPGQQPDAETGRRLFNALVPAAARTGKRFIIVPDGPLCALNFETLPGSGRFWIEDATIAVTPSLDLLALRRPPARPDESLLAVGDAVPWDEDFEKLLNAGKEIDAVKRHFPAAATRILTEAAATPDAYLHANPGNYAYIHFAAHATASRNAPMESAIILSRANGRGRLAIEDILRAPVHANLVTISACRSAGARTYAGEGLVGLAWAFLQSGARDVVAALWRVNDYASPQLMDNLYAEIVTGKAPDTALRDAKLKLIQGGKFTAPYYWGALQLFLGALPR